MFAFDQDQCHLFLPLGLLALLQFDVRKDAEQSTKLDEIVELLLAAGYFRARIKGLNPFDKVRHSVLTSVKWL